MVKIVECKPEGVAQIRPPTSREFERVRRLAYEKFGLDLRDGNEPLVAARLGKKLGQLGLRTYREYLDQYKPQDTVFPWSPRRLEYLLEDIGKDAGLTKHLSFDMCRWTCALNDWRNGIEHDQVRQKLGISKIQWREVSLKLHQLAEK